MTTISTNIKLLKLNNTLKRIPNTANKMVSKIREAGTTSQSKSIKEVKTMTNTSNQTKLTKLEMIIQKLTKLNMKILVIIYRIIFKKKHLKISQT